MEKELIISVAKLIALSCLSSINGIKHSANLERFHFVIIGWLQYAYLPIWSIELNTVFGS